MSKSLIDARKKLNSVNSFLKKGKYMPAVQAVRDAVLIMLKESLMKAERSEFQQLIRDVTYLLNSDASLRKVYPLVIKYEPGNEKQLLGAMNELLNALQEQVADKAKEDLAALERRKEEMLQKGQAHLERKEFDSAKAIFEAIVHEFPDDSDLKANIADRYLKAEQFQDAFKLLDEALRNDPNAIFLYNRIGIVLRKMGDFETAEKYYLKALAVSSTDEYLHFNVGRLYYDWKKWKKMGKAAQRALELNPDFKEAAKMLQFARKKASE